MLDAKMRDRPETNYVAPLNQHGPWVFKYLMTPSGQVLLTSYPARAEISFTVQAAGQGGRSSRDFWVAHGSAGHLGKDLAREPGRITAADVAAVTSAPPLPSPDSLYAYSARPGGRPAAIGYWQRPGDVVTSPLRLCRFVLGGQEVPGLTADLASWWRDADAGRLRCIDDALAAGTAVLALEGDAPAPGYFNLVLDGQVYLADAPHLGSPLGGIMWAGDPSAARRVAEACVRERGWAAAALASARGR
jgi:hypothetical protein